MGSDLAASKNFQFGLRFLTALVLVAALFFGLWTQVPDGPTMATIFLGSVTGRAWAKRRWNRKTWLAAVGAGFTLAAIVEFGKWYFRGGLGAVLSEFFDRLIVPIAPSSLFFGSALDAILRLIVTEGPELPLGPNAKFLSKQIGWPMHLLAILATDVALWVNRSPRVSWGGLAVAFLLWLLLLVLWLARLFVRIIVLRSHGWSWRAALVGWPKWCVLPLLAILSAGIADWRDSRTPRALLDAVRRGDLDAAERALRGGVDVESVERSGWRHENPGKCALTLAAARGDNEIVLLLLRYGADVNRPDGFRETAIIAAAGAGHVSTVQSLLDRGADALARGHEGSAIHAAATWGHVEVMALLIKVGVPIDVTGTHGRTPLHYAAFAGQPSAVQFLLEHGTDQNKPDMNRRTPLDTVQDIIRNRLGEYKRLTDDPEPSEEFLSSLEAHLQVRELLGGSSQIEELQEP